MSSMDEISPSDSPVVARPAERADVEYSDADYTLSADTVSRLLTARPPNTDRAYKHNWAQFTRWCEGQGRVSLPATAQTLCDYVTILMSCGLAPVTIEQAAAAIRVQHRDNSYPEQPDTSRYIELLRAYKREWADEGGRYRKATPVLITALRSMIDTCDPDTLIGKRDRCLLLLGYNGMCRRSELSGLNISDIVFAGEEGLLAYVSHSKTDQEARGAEIPIPFGQHERTCAVRATQEWIGVLTGRGLVTGALLRPVDRHDRIGGETGYAGTKAERLTGSSVSTIVHKRALLAGLDNPGGYTGHSLRAGAATSAYLAGAPVSEIAKHGRWRENSPVVLGYIRAVDQWQNNPMKGIGL